MNETIITPKSTLEEAYTDQERVSDWSRNSKSAYRRNIKDISEHMKSIGLEPTLENVTYNYCLVWKKDHAGKLKPSTLKQQKSTISSLFRHLNNAKVVNGNPFLNVKISDYTGDQYLSKDLNIIELYQVYKAAHELQSDGVNVLGPIMLDIYTGLRSTNLIGLKVKSLDVESGGIRIYFTKPTSNSDRERNKDEKNPNSKNRESFIPLPPKSLEYLMESTKGMDPDDPLLYGLRGKAFANKQMNYIVKKICEHLGWIVKTSDSEEGKDHYEKNPNSKKLKTDKYFTPHGLRYSIATIFHEMGVEDNAIRVLLLHSKKTELGALERYLRRDTREIKQIRMAQLLLETVLETTLDMEEKFGIQMDLDAVYENLPEAFENQMKNIHFVHMFKEQMIRHTMAKMEQMLTQPVGYQNPQYMVPVGNVLMDSYTPNPYQAGFQTNIGTMPGNSYQQQMPNGFYQPNIAPNFFPTKR